MPGTNRIAWRSSTPTTDFYLDGDVIDSDGWTEGVYNGRWLVRIYVTAVNRGNTSSYDGGTGIQAAYIEGGWVGQHGGTPFLPSGVPTNGLRWEEGPFDTWVYANNEGYFEDNNTDLQVGMTVSCPSFNSGNLYGSIYLGRIAQPPPPPNSNAFSPNPDQITNNSMRFRFQSTGDGGSSIIRWEYQYSTSSNFSSGNSAIFSHPTSGTHTITGLNPRTLYYFRARGVNGVATGQWSAVKSATTLDYPDAPTQAFSSKTATSITMSLTDPSYTGGGITAREMQISTDSGFSSVLATDTVSPWSFTGLSRATTYYLRSRVQNSIGWGAWSTTTVVTTDAETPSTPTGYGAHNIASRTAYSTLGTILDNGGAALTQVNYQINTSASATGATDVTLDSAREPVFLGLTPGTLYYYRLRVYNGFLWSGWGSWVSFVSLTNVPHEPTSLAVDSVGDASVTLDWIAPTTLLGATITGYRVTIGTNKALTTGMQQADTGAAELSKVFVGLTPGTTYYARVHSLSTNGNGSTTDLLTFATTNSGTPVGLLWENVGGVWKRIILWENVLGVWKQLTLWENVAGTWKDN